MTDALKALRDAAFVTRHSKLVAVCVDDAERILTGAVAAERARIKVAVREALNEVLDADEVFDSTMAAIDAACAPPQEEVHDGQG